MYQDLSGSEKRLADFMSKISELAYAAGWMKNLEYCLWDAVIKGERRYGRYFITTADINTLIELSKECNRWIYFDNTTEETALTLSEWTEKFANDLM